MTEFDDYCDIEKITAFGPKMFVWHHNHLLSKMCRQLHGIGPSVTNPDDP